MKVCYVTVDVSIPHFRGASTHVYEVARHLTGLGHEVHVVSRKTNRSHPTYENLKGVHIHRIPRGIVAPLPSSSYQQLEREEKPSAIRDRLYEAYLFTLFSLYAGLVSSQVIKKYNIDIVIERETSFGAGAVASIITRRPMILEVIGPRFSKLSVKKASKILAYTKSMLRGHELSDKTIYVEAAADVSAFKPDSSSGQLIRDMLNLGNSIIVGYVGTFAVWHGIKELIEASAQVLKNFPDGRFLMVGPYYKPAQQLARALGLARFFVFTGPIPYVNIPKYINACDILVAPYNPCRSEQRRKYGIGSPLKVFEYMACGKPAITTALEPITRVITNWKTGVLIPPGDSKALSKAIIHLAKKPELRKKIGKVARKEVEKHYSWKTFAKKIEQLLKEVLETQKPRD